MSPDYRSFKETLDKIINSSASENSNETEILLLLFCSIKSDYDLVL